MGINFTSSKYHKRERHSCHHGVFGNSMDVGGIMGLLGSSAGGGLGAYKNTPQGKVVVAAMTDAFNNLVVAVKNYRAQEATGPKGMGTGGKLKVN